MYYSKVHAGRIVAFLGITLKVLVTTMLFWVVENSNIFYFHPEHWGFMDPPIWLIFFQMGWNHQLCLWSPQKRGRKQTTDLQGRNEVPPETGWKHFQNFAPEIVSGIASRGFQGSGVEIKWIDSKVVGDVTTLPRFFGRDWYETQADSLESRLSRKKTSEPVEKENGGARVFFGVEDESWDHGIFERHVRRSQRNTSRDRDFRMIFLAKMPAIFTHDKKNRKSLLAPLKIW